MAEHKVGNTVVLTGTITEIQGTIAMVRVDRSFPSGTTTIAVRLGTLPAAPYGTAHAEQREELIRDAMTEAQHHPRTITR